jgi:hypothetical protein
MPKQETQRTTRPIIAIIATMFALGGCAQVNDWLRGSSEQRQADDESVNAPATEVYLNDLYALASGDPATQAEIFADSEAAATLTPDPSTRLRLALVLATPGHAESNAERAQDIFRDLLSQAELLSSVEISLATIHLQGVEQQLMLQQEAARLRAESSRTASTEQRAIEQRIARVEAENRNLRRSLAEAEQKLDAITSIERSIREQTGNGNNQQ